MTTIENGKPVCKTYPTITPSTYVEFYTTFLQALQGEADVPVKPEDARDVLRIIEAAKESSSTGKSIDL